MCRTSEFKSRSEATAEKVTRRVSNIYLGEDGSPDGLNLLNLGGGDEGLDLVGLEEKLRLATVEIFDCNADSMFLE